MTLLVIDTQEMITTNKLYAFKTFEKNMIELINTARKCGVRIIYVRHDDGYELTKGAKGFDIYPPFAPEKGELVFDKHYNSAFRQTGLLEYLQEKNESVLMITGLQTDYCIDASVKCGFEHGFSIIVPEFCNTTVDNEFMSGEQTYRYYNQKMWPKRYASCVSFQKALELLMK
jgi:nicotinamidase-related amidase